MRVDIFIFNHGHFNQSLRLFKSFKDLGQDPYILNCAGPLDPLFKETDRIIKLPNIYYSGQWNEALKRFSGDVLFIINADVNIPNLNFLMKRLVNFYEHFGESAGLYAPDHYWTPWTYDPSLLETIEHGYKKVPMTDSTIWSITRDIAVEVGEVDINTNLYGWGIEIVAAYYCFLKNKHVVRDYYLKCLHPQGTGYNRHEADMQWRQWIKNKGLDRDFWNYYHSRDKFGFGWRGDYTPAKNLKYCL